MKFFYYNLLTYCFFFLSLRSDIIIMIINLRAMPACP